MLKFLISTGLMLLLLTSHVTAEQPVADYFDLGDFERPIKTDSDAAQAWFNRGLAMCYAFNHEEGARCFEKAFAADPTAPMTLWGLCYSLCPNFNNMEIPSEQMARAAMAIRLAQLSVGAEDSVEKFLISAIQKRCTMSAVEEGEQLNQNYANAMRQVYQRFPDDPDVAALYAEALITLQPWMHWDKDGVMGKQTPEIVTVLESALKRWPDHPGLCHFYIHTMEMSPTPEKATAAANRLRNAMPEAGHMVHMPSHIDVHLGNYDQVVQTNLKAIEADKKFIPIGGRNNFYTYYRIHNYHFAVYGAMFDGQSKVAMEMARAIPEQIPPEMLLEQTDYLDAFIPTTLHVMIRFGRWDDILKEQEPAEFLPVSRSIWHYARGLAFAAKGMVPEAEAEQQAFLATLETVPETSALFNNTSRDILSVAESMLAGEIAYRRGEFDEAFEKLREAVRRDDSLNYDEPWAWMQPARHALGALLLEQSQLEEAEQVYREDLERHPKNLWALQGLTETLEKKDASTEAKVIRLQFEKASSRADVKIDRSCYCRLSTESDCCSKE